jgi:hypothetical protein
LVTTPPASRPIDPPEACVKLKTPIALARSPGWGNSVTIMPRITAEAIAPPAPCRKRAATSMAGVWAAPQAIEAAVKSVRPARNTRRRPSRSPRRPASRSSPPNAIR